MKKLVSSVVVSLGSGALATVVNVLEQTFGFVLILTVTCVAKFIVTFVQGDVVRVGAGRFKHWADVRR